MKKTLSLETLAGLIEIQYRDAGEYFELEELSLPKDTVEECSGIWKDDSVFELLEYGMRLRIPTNVLIGIINATRNLVNDKDTSWWDRESELHKKFKDLVKPATAKSLT